MQTDRQIRADTGAEQQGIARQKDILLTRLLKRRLDGLHKFRTILRQADAEIAKRSQSNTPRNAPCPCGSGEKYKRCCGRHAPPVLHGPVSQH
jgi:hypothetical protein